MKTTYISWRFKTDDDFFGSMKKKLEPATKLHWVDYGTEKRYKDDWLGADIGDKARLYFYLHYKGILDAVLKVASEDTEHDACIAAARHKVLTEILPIVGAREVEEVETKRRYMDSGNSDRE
ncbi:MAG: hypothetical protein JNJ46_23350 [Myxococcales bacterium]|nr:hypothetical protein [Myxococcales bacterium]